MESNNLYSLSPNEDITIIILRSELLILENTYLNQNMMNSYVFTYHGAEVKCVHRSMADMVTLDQALSSVGLGVLVFHGIQIPILKWKLTGQIKTDPVFNLLMFFISIQPYRVRFLKIQHLLLLQMYKFSTKKKELLLCFLLCL